MILFHTISTHCDFEFASNTLREIDYSISIPANPEGLVVYIAGFGDDARTYRTSFQQYVRDKFSLACLTVDYHCFFSRTDNGGSLAIELPVMNLLRSLTGCGNNESVDDVLLKASQLRVDSAIPLRVPGLLIPAKNEYQNFGLLPALDHIFAINDVLRRYSNIPKKIYSIGSSYGGYIANLISKLAPRTLNAVFDNSSWAIPNKRFIIGHDLGLPELTAELTPNIVIEGNVLSPWSSFDFMPNAFGKSRILMRSFPETHLVVMKKTGYGKTVYRFVHSSGDEIANTDQKKSLVNQMKLNGFNAQIEVFSSSDIDGRYIKNMDHGMGLSMRQFFAKCFEESKSLIIDDQRTDFDFEHSIEYICDDLIYSISYRDHLPPVCSISLQPQVENQTDSRLLPNNQLIQ